MRATHGDESEPSRGRVYRWTVGQEDRDRVPGRERPGRSVGVGPPEERRSEDSRCVDETVDRATRSKDSGSFRLTVDSGKSKNPCDHPPRGSTPDTRRPLSFSRDQDSAACGPRGRNKSGPDSVSNRDGPPVSGGGPCRRGGGRRRGRGRTGRVRGGPLPSIRGGRVPVPNTPVSPLARRDGRGVPEGWDFPSTENSWNK